MSQLLPSKDIREYAKQQRKEFTDFEKAVLIYHNSSLGTEEKTDILSKLKDSTMDIELKTQLEERLDYDRQCVEMFYRRTDDVFYSLEALDEKQWIEEGYFISAELAITYGKKLNKRFIVHKIQLITKVKRQENDRKNVLAAVTYDEQGDFIGCWNDKVKWNADKSINDSTRFENAYIEIPHPFQLGDVVQIVGSEQVGIILEKQTKEEKRGHLSSTNKDYSECNIRLEYMDDKGEFVHTYVPLVEIEYAKLDKCDPKKLLLESASRLLQGAGSFEEFLIEYDKFQLSKKSNFFC